MIRSTLFASVLTLLVIALPSPSLSVLTRQAQYTKATPDWNQPVKPFRVIGNIYYVGASEVSSFLITTPKGHILLDSGFAETVPLIADGIKQLGFKIEDAKVLINSHAHYDHAAGLAQLKRLTGAQLMLSEPEAALVANGGKGDSQWGDNFELPGGSSRFWLWWPRFLHEFEFYRLWYDSGFVCSFEQQFYSFTADVTIVNRVVVDVHPDKRISQSFRHPAAVLHRVTHGDLTVL